jgi:hypothetical protein
VSDIALTTQKTPFSAYVTMIGTEVAVVVEDILDAPADTQRMVMLRKALKPRTCERITWPLLDSLAAERSETKGGKWKGRRTWW